MKSVLPGNQPSPVVAPARPDQDAQVEVGLLGGFLVRSGGIVLELPPSTCRLVALLALERRLWSRSRVCRVLYPDQDDLRSLGTLRTVLWRTRMVARSLIDVTMAGLALTPAALVDVDRVGSLAEQLDSSASIDLEEIDPLIFAQELLPEWPDDFLNLHREHCRQRNLHALENLARRWAQSGHPARALQAGLTAVEQAPLRESAHRIVIEIHLDEGNFAEARRQYELLSRVLRNELGLVPSDELRSLVVPDTPGRRGAT